MTYTTRMTTTNASTDMQNMIASLPPFFLHGPCATPPARTTERRLCMLHVPCRLNRRRCTMRVKEATRGR